VAAPTALPTEAPTLEPTAAAATPTGVPEPGASAVGASNTATIDTILDPSPIPAGASVSNTPSAESIEDIPLLVEGQTAPTAEPTPVGEVAAPSEPVRLVIASIKLDRKLISVGLDQRRAPIVPKHDVAWYNLSAKPGQGENVVMWGHVLRFKSAPKIAAPFARLKEVPVGARITVYTADGRAHAYVVREQIWATPDQVEYILPRGAERLTLVSCIGDKVVAEGSLEMSHRLITIAVPEA
jgi:hypothetical protein